MKEKLGDIEDNLISPGTSGLNKDFFFLRRKQKTDIGNIRKFPALKIDLNIVI